MCESAKMRADVQPSAIEDGADQGDKCAAVSLYYLCSLSEVLFCTHNVAYTRAYALPLPLTSVGAAWNLLSRSWA